MQYIDIIFDLFKPKECLKEKWLSREKRLKAIYKSLDEFCPAKGVGRLPWMYVYRFLLFKRKDADKDVEECLTILGLFDDSPYASSLQVKDASLHPTLITRDNVSLNVDTLKALDKYISMLETEAMQKRVMNVYKAVLRSEEAVWFITEVDVRCLKDSFSYFDSLSSSDNAVALTLGYDACKGILSSKSKVSKAQLKHLWRVYFRVCDYISGGLGDFLFPKSVVVGYQDFVDCVLAEPSYASIFSQKDAGILESTQRSKTVSTLQLSNMLTLRSEIMKVFRCDLPKFAIPDPNVLLSS